MVVKHLVPLQVRALGRGMPLQATLLLVMSHREGKHRTRAWDATPGHATPGHVTPGRETPSHDKGASSRRNRSDETPKTERGKVL